jgi:hypothetical protein
MKKRTFSDNKRRGSMFETSMRDGTRFEIKTCFAFQRICWTRKGRFGWHKRCWRWRDEHGDPIAAHATFSTMTDVGGQLMCVARWAVPILDDNAQSSDSDGDVVMVDASRIRE